MHVSRIQYDRPFGKPALVEPGSPRLPALLLVLLLTVLGLAMAFPVNPAGCLATGAAATDCGPPDCS